MTRLILTLAVIAMMPTSWMLWPSRPASCRRLQPHQSALPCHRRSDLWSVALVPFRMP